MCKAFFWLLSFIIGLSASWAARAAELYWNDGNMIHRAALDGSGAQNVAATSATLGIAPDPGAGLFWTDDVPRVPVGPTGTIRHSDLAGGGMTDLVPGIPTPVGIALDVPDGKMYWTDSNNVIHRANLDGSNAENLVQQPYIADLSGIVVDALHNRLYFSYVNPLIESARPGGIGSTNLNGSDFQVAVGGLINPQGLALDSSGNLYWADVDRIQRAPIGGMAQDWVTGLNRPFALALDLADQALFVTDPAAGTLDRAPLSGGVATPVLSKLNNPTAIAVIATPSTWIGITSTNWIDAGNWLGPIPGATSGTTNTDTATFNNSGNGRTSIVIDAGRNLESIAFDTAAVAYTIGATGGNALLLTNSGQIQIAATFLGSNVTETVKAPLILEGSYTFANNSTNAGVLLDFGGAVITAANPLTLSGRGNISISGSISGVGSINKAGSGTVYLTGANSYSGGTTVTAGLLVTNTLGDSGSPIVVSAAAGVNSALVLGGGQQGQTVGSLAGTVAPSGLAVVSISANDTLTVNQATNTTFGGTIWNSGTLIKSGAGTLEVQGAPIWGDLSSIQVAGGGLRLNVASGTPSIGSGVAAIVSSGATLELAGSVSALANGANRVNIMNKSNTPGILVSGTNQQVGGIDGSGTTQVNAGSDLTANHIVQSAIIVGGTSKNPGLVTIDASDASGNPLAIGPSLVNSLSSSDPFGADVSATRLVGTSPTDGLDSGGPAQGSLSAAAGLAAVPEPSGLLLLALGGLLSGLAIARQMTSHADSPAKTGISAGDLEILTEDNGTLPRTDVQFLTPQGGTVLRVLE